ncbi:protein of unknown function [Paraburkholderia phenazinium]|jgi:hypothetical protein|uniref:DUF4148 domain-containing protein n=2 Tax=Burkholderiaceae TaxID=119060 RepID=A0A1N6GT63_9BURK|nr:protein of unknown function [Paraburkholderia phenazinium]
MKTLICLSLAVSALASPALSFAQSTNAPVTRAQVYTDLVRLEQAGYNPSTSGDANYPADIQAAEAKVAAQDNEGLANNANAAAEATGMGAGLSGSSESGTHAPVRGTVNNPACVGPVSFCSLYSGS